MHLRTWPATALALLATLGAALAALTSNALSAQPDGLRALDGEWIYVEDRTEGRTLEQLGPPMASKFSMRDESRSGKRAWARWTWNKPSDANATGDKSLGRWSEPWFTVPDPTCMASLIRHPRGELLFSNPNSATQRIALTIRTSR